MRLTIFFIAHWLQNILFNKISWVAKMISPKLLDDVIICVTDFLYYGILVI